MKTGKRKLTTTALMTGKEAKILTGKKRQAKFLLLGEKRTKGGCNAITPLQEQSGLVNWFANRACAVVSKNLWRIMKITTGRWMLYGFVSHATNKDIKKY